MANFMKDEDVENTISKLIEEFKVIKQEEDAESEEEEEVKNDAPAPIVTDSQVIKASVDPKASIIGKSTSKINSSQQSLNKTISEKEVPSSANSRMSQEVSQNQLASQKSQSEYNGTQGSNTRKTSEMSKSKLTTPRVDPKSMESSIHQKETKPQANPPQKPQGNTSNVKK